jgi:CubicO group peptidase (beta-lactamase class C family)
MNNFKIISKWTVISIFITIAAIYLTGNGYFLKALVSVYGKGYTTAYLNDYTVFDNQIIHNGTPKPWPKHKFYNKIEETDDLKKLNQYRGTTAFLIIKNDSILYEKYIDEDFGPNSKSNSFSMAKSYVTGLLGKAIDEGHIKGLDQPISDFFNEYKTGWAAEVTLGDLASMASGSNWSEAYYSPFSITTKAYYGTELEKLILGLKTVKKPGKSFVYSSGDTQLLGMAIERATGQKLYHYLSESFWKPLGSEHEALWQVDSKKNDMAKAYCCIASNAKDFARFGKLYKDYGKWEGKQIIDSSFTVKSTNPRFETSPEYGYGWWLNKINDKSFFMMEGHLGQCVIVEREDNLILVRLGKHKEFFGENPYNGDITTYIKQAYKMLENNNIM